MGVPCSKNDNASTAVSVVATEVSPQPSQDQAPDPVDGVQAAPANAQPPHIRLADGEPSHTATRSRRQRRGTRRPSSPSRHHSEAMNPAGFHSIFPTETTSPPLPPTERGWIKQSPPAPVLTLLGSATRQNSDSRREAQLPHQAVLARIDETCVANVVASLQAHIDEVHQRGARDEHAQSPRSLREPSSLYSTASDPNPLMPLGAGDALQ